MKDYGVNKIPRSNIVEINGTVHQFLITHKLPPHLKEIYLKLEEINRRVQVYGHELGTREVLFDIKEEEKEGALSYHSERLAIAFALIVSVCQFEL